MKNRLSHIFFLALLVMLLSCTAIPAAAATLKCVPTSTSLPVSERTVNGTSFWTKNYKSGGYDLYAIKSGKKYMISKKADGSGVVSDGSIVYYIANMPKGKYLYRYTISNKKKKSIGKLCSAKDNAELCGYYDNQIFFINNGPDGSFDCISLEDGDVDSLLDNPNFGVTTAEQHGKYFTLSDGTGAGHSYVGVYDVSKLFFDELWSRPVTWHATSYNIYCAALRQGYLPAKVGNPAVVHVAKYNYKTRIYTVYATYVEVTRIISISNKKMVYLDGDGIRKTLSF